MVACIGPLIELTTPHLLLLGDLRRESMGEILERPQSNTILHMIRVGGPYKLVTLIREAGRGGYLPEQIHCEQHLAEVLSPLIHPAAGQLPD